MTYQVNSDFKKIDINDNIELAYENFEERVVAYNIKDINLQYRITPNDLLTIDQPFILS